MPRIYVQPSASCIAARLDIRSSCHKAWKSARWVVSQSPGTVAGQWRSTPGGRHRRGTTRRWEGCAAPLGLTPSRLGADAVQQTSSSSHRQASSTSPTPGGPSLLSCNRPSLDQAHGHDDGWKPASSGRPSTWDAMSATTAAPMYPGVVRPTLRHWLEKARTARPCSRCAPAHISTETNPAAGTGPEPTSSKAARHPGGHPAPCADLPDHTLSISHARRALMGIHGK